MPRKQLTDGQWSRIEQMLPGKATAGVCGQHDCASPSTCGGCPKKAGPQALGRSRGGLSTKIHALVEGLGNPALWILTGGQVHDVTQAIELLQGIKGCLWVVADKAYDADRVLDHIEAMGAQAVIPPKANRREPHRFDQHQYEDRNLIERSFCRIKHFRRIATRYDKLASRFSSFIALAATLIWLQ